MHIPKDGSSAEEYEDAFWPMESSEGSCINRFAVADGATETSYSGLWARLLVQAYCRGEMDSRDQIPETLEHLQRQWRSQLSVKPLPWFAEHKLQLGAFAAFLGLTINDDVQNSSEGTWVAVASGDSCLVQFRGDELIAAFPLGHSDEFNSHPILLSTDPQALILGLENLTINSGRWESGDHFFLMTDALAAWFFREHEEMKRPWETLRDVEVDLTRPFEGWVTGLRGNHEMRNDDVTLYRIEID